MKELTKRQQQVLNFIQTKQDAEGITPTYREIAGHFRFRSPNAALAHVHALRKKGYLTNLTGRARTFKVIDPSAPTMRTRPRIARIPIYGTIPAGRPTDAAQDPEGFVLIDVETLDIRPSTRTFGLKVQGDSMIGKHIVSGDIAVIEQGMEPRSGDVVAALIDGQVTLKTFVLQRNKPYLRAENPRFPKLIPQEELQVQGVLVGLVRKRQTSR